MMRRISDSELEFRRRNTRDMLLGAETVLARYQNPTAQDLIELLRNPEIVQRWQQIRQLHQDSLAMITSEQQHRHQELQEKIQKYATKNNLESTNHTKTHYHMALK